jgi:alginate O-acetyltransferase complex protein AlgF
MNRMTSMTHIALNKRLFALSLLMVGMLGPRLAWAQQTTLYDPQPPANSAYVRIIWGAAASAFDVSVDNKKRLSAVPPATPSDYMILPAGKHDITVQVGSSVHKIPVDAESSRSITILLTEDGKKTKATTIEDKINSNKLKAIISAYHLGGVPPVDVSTADGKTRIFSGMATGSSASLVVNPISLAYMLSQAGSKESIASANLEMKSGEVYSIVIFQDKTGRSQTKAFTNTVERYQK